MAPLTISILNHNGGEVLEKCIEAVFLQNLPKDCEIQIIDNASTDGSGEKAFKSYPIDFLCHSNNYHQFITGLNETFRYAKYDLVLFITQDVFLQRGCLKKLLEIYEKFAPSIIQPVFYDLKGKVQNAGMQWIWPGYGLATKYKTKFPEVMETEIFATGCFLMSKKIFTQIGPFDEELAPAFYEDVDYSIRAKKEKIRLLVAREAKVNHIGSHSFSVEYGIQKIKGTCHKNRLYVVRKHYQGWRKILRLGTIQIIDAIRAILSLDNLKIFSKSNQRMDSSLFSLLKDHPQSSGSSVSSGVSRDANLNG